MNGLPALGSQQIPRYFMSNDRPVTPKQDTFITPSQGVMNTLQNMTAGTVVGSVDLFQLEKTLQVRWQRQITCSKQL